jgi:hypothetical protein
VRSLQGSVADSERVPPPDTTVRPPAAADSARIARRWLLKAAVFGPSDRPDLGPAPRDPVGPPDRDRVPRAIIGQVVDVSPHVLVIATEHAEERFALTADATAWRGRRTEPAAIRLGDHAIVRRHASGRDVVDRIWANIGRVTGIIVQRHGDTVHVDGGDGRPPHVLVIPSQAAGRIQVRFPRLQPGYLIDIIGLRHDGYLEALVPAGPQPAYRADHVPGPALISGHLPAAIRGSAVWHEPGRERADLAGLAYPAVDELAGPVLQPYPAVSAFPALPPGQRPIAPHVPVHHAPGLPPYPVARQHPMGWPPDDLPTLDLQAGTGCVSLPYLSVGSRLRVHNDCTGDARVLPVTGASPTARLFCDRSTACGPSPRGRVADLTVASFVELGGELDQGNFNATIEIED